MERKNMCPYKAGYNNANANKPVIRGVGLDRQSRKLYVLGYNTWIKEQQLIDLLCNNRKNNHD